MLFVMVRGVGGWSKLQLPPPPPLPPPLPQEKLQELTELAQEVVKIDMYRPETCSVLGQRHSVSYRTDV